MRCERAVNFDPRDSCVSLEGFLVSIRSIKVIIRFKKYMDLRSVKVFSKTKHIRDLLMASHVCLFVSHVGTPHKMLIFR